MVGIEGIGSVPELANTKPTPVRDQKSSASNLVNRSDGVAFSDKAQEAAQLMQTLKSQEEQQAVRQKQVEEARKNVEQGTYKVVSVILQVAARVGNIVV